MKMETWGMAFYLGDGGADGRKSCKIPAGVPPQGGCRTPAGQQQLLHGQGPIQLLCSGQINEDVMAGWNRGGEFLDGKIADVPDQNE